MKNIYRVKFLESCSLEEITRELKKLGRRQSENRLNIGRALLKVEQEELYLQKKKYISFSEYIAEIAEKMNVSTSTLYQWMSSYAVYEDYKLFFIQNNVDPVLHFSKLIVLRKVFCVSYSHVSHNEIMQKFAKSSVREFIEYSHQLLSSTTVKQSNKDTSKKSIDSRDLTENERAIYHGVSYGYHVVLIGVQNVKFSNYLHKRISSERKKEYEYQKTESLIHDVDPENPFKIISYNMHIDELEKRIILEMKKESFNSGVIALGIYYIHVSPELTDEIIALGYKSASDYCMEKLCICRSAVSMYCKSGQMLVEHKTDLEKYGYNIGQGFYKLIYLEHALNNHQDKEVVFTALSRLSYRDFVNFAQKNIQEDSRKFNSSIQKKAQQYIDKLHFIEARGDIPAIFLLHSEYEKIMLLRFYSDKCDSALNKPDKQKLLKAN